MEKYRCTSVYLMTFYGLCVLVRRYINLVFYVILFCTSMYIYPPNRIIDIHCYGPLPISFHTYVLYIIHFISSHFYELFLKIKFYVLRCILLYIYTTIDLNTYIFYALLCIIISIFYETLLCIIVW